MPGRARHALHVAIRLGQLLLASAVALAVFLPGLVVIAAFIGLLLAARLKSADSAGFARLGAGQEA